ncbi:MAG: FAD-dependent oxidoreductase [Rickettsiales bacterium]|nr:FAD-dependent oxidoreductase [Rickettsiales bacterium]
MKIAIIGTGISGLSSAYLLHPHHEITVYEKNEVLGGHSRTVEVKVPEGKVPVDTGFIVFNHRNYPHLTALFEHLKVPTAKSDMSFGVSIDKGWLEYGTQQLGDMFAQKRNLLRPAYWRMIRDILTFNKQAGKYLEQNTTLTLGECLDEMKLGPWFRDYYLLAMGGAIWSTPLEKMLAFPAQAFLQFFDNHGLLSINDQPQWHTVVGGSREYVKRLSASFKERIKLNCGVKHVTRHEGYVEIEDAQGETHKYDQVIFACHSDQAMQLLQNPTPKEQDIVGSIRYQPNEMVLHTDTSFMQKRRNAWSSWVYLSEQRNDQNPAVSLSYWMNNLQPLDTKIPVIVTLNPGRAPDAATIQDRYSFEHPVFDASAIHAQSRMHEIQGKDRIWYCGAWQRNGFHEDGLWSAVRVAKELGVDIPWK